MIIKVVLFCPLYLADQNFFALKLLSIIDIGYLSALIYAIFFKLFIKNSTGGQLSAFNIYAGKIIKYSLGMVVYLHLLSCFWVVYYKGEIIQVELGVFEQYSSSFIWRDLVNLKTYLHYLHFGMNASINKGSTSVNDGSTTTYSIMLLVTLLSTGFFVMSVLLLYGLMLELKRVENLAKEQSEELDLWFYNLCVTSKVQIPEIFAKQLFHYFDFFQNISVTGILQSSELYQQMSSPLQAKLKLACVKVISSVFNKDQDIFSQEFLSTLIMHCQPMA